MINLKKYQLIIFFLLISLVISGSLLAQESSEIPFDRIKTPTELEDIIDTFEKLKYNFVSFKEENKVQDVVIEYQYQGREDVNGVEADKIFIGSTTMKTSESSQTNLWLADGEIVKMIQNEQEIPPAMAEPMKEQMLEAVFFPFYNFKELDLERIASKGEVSRKQEVIGETELDIITIKSNDLAEYGMESGTVKLADFENFLMTVSFDFISMEEAERKYEESHFKIEEIELQ